MYTTEPTASERRPGGGREQNQNTEIHEKTQIHAAKKTENNIEINDIDHMRFKTTRPAELIHISVSWTLCLVLATCWSVFTSASAQTSFNRTRETDRLTLTRTRKNISRSCCCIDRKVKFRFMTGSTDLSRLQTNF